MRKPIDPRCLELAKVFLAKDHFGDEELAKQLAGDIQDAVESFFRWLDEEDAKRTMYRHRAWEMR